MTEPTPETAENVINTENGDQVVVSADGSATVTSSGGVEFVFPHEGQPKVAGLTAFGIDDLASVERFETVQNGNATTHNVFFRGGSVGTVTYVDGAFFSYGGRQLGMSVRKLETKAYLRPGDEKPAL